MLAIIEGEVWVGHGLNTKFWKDWVGGTAGWGLGTGDWEMEGITATCGFKCGADGFNFLCYHCTSLCITQGLNKQRIAIFEKLLQQNPLLIRHAFFGK